MFFFKTSFLCNTCSPQQCSSFEAKFFAFFMMIQIGTITDLILSINSFSNSLSIQCRSLRQRCILVHLKVIQADTTSVFNCTTLPRRVQSWICYQHCINNFLFRSDYFITSIKYLSRLVILSSFFSTFFKFFLFGHSVLVRACCSSQILLHQQQNQHWQRHFIWQQPTFFSIGCLHLGHYRVLFFIHQLFAVYELISLYHSFTLSHEIGQWGSFWHLKQQSQPQGHVTVLSSIMLGFIQKQGHFQLGQQQMSLFWIAQFMHIFFLFSSDSLGAIVSRKVLRIGAFQQGGEFMHLEKIRPFINSYLRQQVQQGLQQK